MSTSLSQEVILNLLSDQKITVQTAQELFSIIETNPSPERNLIQLTIDTKEEALAQVAHILECIIRDIDLKKASSITIL